MMKMYPSWFMFFSISIMSIMMVLCGNNWFSMWLGFELSLMAFLPMFSGSSLMMESLIKYLLIQAGGSSIFALSFIMPNNYLTHSLVYASMFMKLGVFPFHSWVPLIMTNMSWCGCFLLSSIQKVSPLLLIYSQSQSNLQLLTTFGILSMLTSGMLGYNQTYMRSLMAYSSISHTGWLLITINYNFNLFLMYMLIYYCLIMILFSFFAFLKVNKVVTKSYGMMPWLMMNTLILSMSGIPPFSMFYMKVSVIYFMMNNFYFIPFALLSTMMSVYYYLTFVIPTLPTFMSEFYTNTGKKFPMMTFMACFMIPLPVMF